MTFQHARERRFDLIVGADGVHSRVRSLAFGPESSYVHHLGGYGAFLTVRMPVALDGWLQIYTAPDGRWVGLRPDYDPLQARALLNFRSPQLDFDRRDVDLHKQILRTTFAGLGWHTQCILDAMREADDFYFDSTSRVVVPEWSRARIALLGDAGYCGAPLAGHGTALSLVGAYGLAGDLAVADGNHLRAFDAYQEQLQAYVDQRTQLPPGGIRMAMPMTSAGIWLRNASTRLMTSRPLRGMIAKAAVQPDAISLMPYAGQPTPATPSHG